MHKLIFFFFIFYAGYLFGQVGVIDESGSIRLPFEYEKLNNISGSDCLIAKKGGNYGLIERDGTVVLPFIYQKIKSIPKKRLIEVYKKDVNSGVVYQGLTDYAGDVVVEANTYTKLSSFSDKFFYGFIKESDGVIFDRVGKLLKKHAKCSDVRFLSDSTYTACKGKETYRIDLPEAIRITEFNQVTQLDENVYSARDNTMKFGLINKNDEIISPFVYQIIRKIGNNRYAAKKSIKETHFINSKGDILKKITEYDRISLFKEGFATVSKDGKIGLVNSLGKLTVPTIYQFVKSLRDGNFQVQKDDKQWIINAKNEMLTPSKYGELRTYLNLKNEFLVPLACFEKNGLYGVLNDKYQEIIFDMDNKGIKDAFFDGLSYRYQIKYSDNTYSLRDRDFTNLASIPAGLSPASGKNKNKFVVMNMENSRYGLVDKKGDFILPAVFKSLKSYLVEGQYIAKLEDVKLYLDPNQKMSLRF